ncbi:bifunctional coenzyme A synthase-like isoform X2 [Ornithodoros turicata]|uniref:bifunctional coenzyme A synthase-like isoform X2 n=1 Tax=Ornithodoros turicata TaxID=34597 RepID=UPI00313A22DA
MRSLLRVPVAAKRARLQSFPSRLRSLTSVPSPMFQTGLLILTSSPRILTCNVAAYLKAAKHIVNKTLYIKLEPNRHQLWPVQQPVFTPSELSLIRKLIPDIYYKAAGACSHLDIRVLQSCFKDTHGNEEHLRASFDVVLTDTIQEITDVERYVNHQFNRKCTNYQNLADKLPQGSQDGGVSNNHDLTTNGCFRTYESVCLGGTFDRLHIGHKVLLSEAVLHASEKVVIGVTDGDMLKGKLLWELIEPIEVRIKVLTEFLEEVDSTLKYDVMPIYDPYGPTIVDPNLKCLYVSDETLKGGKRVNEERAKRGMPPMVLRSVSLAEDVCRTGHEEFKISSSTLRSRALGTILQPPQAKPNLAKWPYVIGLTGGICAGKSHISELLGKLGAAVINCDKLGHETYLPGRPAYAKVVNAFGKGILNADETVDRKKLGAIVFADEEKRKLLNSFVWPEIGALLQQKIKDISHNGTKVVVLEVAMLLEAGWDEHVHQVWVSIVPEKEAIRRIMERDNLTEEQALQRVHAQQSNKEKVAKANVVFSTLWEYSITEQQVQRAWKELQLYLNSEELQSHN